MNLSTRLRCLYPKLNQFSSDEIYVSIMIVLAFPGYHISHEPMSWLKWEEKMSTTPLCALSATTNLPTITSTIYRHYLRTYLWCAPCVLHLPCYVKTFSSPFWHLQSQKKVLDSYAITQRNPTNTTNALAYMISLLSPLIIVVFLASAYLTNYHYWRGLFVSSLLFKSPSFSCCFTYTFFVFFLVGSMDETHFGGLETSGFGTETCATNVTKAHLVKPVEVPSNLQKFRKYMLTLTAIKQKIVSHSLHPCGDADSLPPL